MSCILFLALLGGTPEYCANLATLTRVQYEDARAAQANGQYVYNICRRVYVVR
jgi:hypothetical protein